MKQLQFSPSDRILAIFPHPDDEVLTCGGFLHYASSIGCHTSLLTLTKGEKGVEGAKYTPELKDIRTNELHEVQEVLGIDDVMHVDLGDGELEKKPKELKKEVVKAIKKVKPTMVLTYDLSGLYGHPDHIVTSKIVTDLYSSKEYSFRLIYTTVPAWKRKLVKLPTHMANDPEFMSHFTYPNRHFFIGRSVKQKWQALQAHKSQHFAFTKSTPFGLPMWSHVLGSIVEGFWEVE